MDRASAAISFGAKQIDKQIDNDRKEADQKRNHHLGRQSEAEPHHQKRRDRHLWNGLRSDKYGIKRALGDPDLRQRGGKQGMLTTMAMTKPSITSMMVITGMKLERVLASVARRSRPPMAAAAGMPARRRCARPPPMRRQ